MKIQHVQIGLALLVTLLLGSFASAQTSRPHAYFAKQIWSGDSEPIADGVMIVAAGKVVSVGPRDSQKIPPNAIVHELGGHCIIPGLVAANSNLAGSQTEERTLTPQIRALDGFDFFTKRDSLLEAGITTVRLAPANNRLMPGVGGVVQLAGDDSIERILNEEDALEIVLTAAARNPPRIYEPPVGPVSEDRPLEATRPQLSTLTATLAGLRQILRQATAENTYVSSGTDPIVEEVSRLVRNKKPLRINATTVPEIRGAVSLAKEFKMPIVLAGCVDLKPFHSVFEDWQPLVKGVVLPGASPGRITNPSIDSLKNVVDPLESARELLDAGIPVSIQVAADSDLKNLMYIGGRLQRDGLSVSETLAALTSTPAKLIGVDDVVGSLTSERVADFIVLNAEPFRLHTRIEATYAAGNPVFERSKKSTTTVVRADRVYLGDGHYMDDASVVVKGKSIRGVGENVSSPADASIKSFDGGVIVPGFVDLGTGLGLGGPLSGAITLSTRLGEQLYSDDPAIDYARRHGVTTVLLGTGSAGKASPVVGFKLGPELRVLGDPIAVRFSMSGDTATAESSNERLLKAGKAYSDSWIKYEKDFAEYEAKLKAQTAAKKTTASKPEAKKEEASEKKTESKESPKKDPEKKEPEKKDPDKKEPEKKDKKEVEKKEKNGDDKDKEKKKPLPDPITGSWEGEIDFERIPPQFRAFKFELTLDEKGVVTGFLEFFGREIEIVSGSYDRETKALSILFEQRGNEVEIAGSLDDAGNFNGTIELGRMGEVNLSAERTVDKSKKPEEESEEPEKKDPDKKDPEKEKPKKEVPEKDEEKKEVEKPKKDPPKDEKNESKDVEEKKKTDEKKEEEKKTESKPETEKKPELKAPRKPRKSDALEPYRALFAGKIPAMVEARSLTSIKAAAELFSKKYKLRTVIVGGDSLVREPDLLKDYDVAIAAGPQLSIAREKLPNANLPQVIANEQIPFGFLSAGTTGVGQLPSAVQFSVSQGLSSSDALQALTQTPATILSKDMKFGKIQKGQDADLVVLSGPPFELATQVLAVMVDGVWVYQKEEQE